MKSSLLTYNSFLSLIKSGFTFQIFALENPESQSINVTKSGIEF